MMISFPIMLQNGITNFVSLLDNIMVGAVGTEQMSGVSIVGQLLFVYYLCIFGGFSGVGIFTSQYYGKGNTEGVRDTFRFKFLLSLLLFGLGIFIFTCFGDQLIQLYLHEGGETGDLEATATYGHAYLMIMLWSLFPFALQQVYASTLRECGETMLPMKAGIIAITVNLFLNYLLIFGHAGFPKLGVVGAAVATVVSRYVECGIIVWWTHFHKQRASFIIGAYKDLRVPRRLTREIIVKGTPLLINETLWSSGMAVVSQSSSLFGLAVVAALNITSTVSNLFSVVWLSMGTAVSIIVGHQLGASHFEEAKDSVRKITTFSVVVSTVVALFMMLLAGLFPMLYNTSDEVRNLAAVFLRISLLAYPINAFANCAYFALRSGGKTWVTFLFDCGFLWVVRIPLLRLLIFYSEMPMLLIYTISTMIDLLKCIVGFVLLKRGEWVNNIVES